MVEFFVQGKPRITTSTGYMSPAPTYTSSTKPKTIFVDTSKLDTQLYSDIQFRRSGPMSIPTQDGSVVYKGKDFIYDKPPSKFEESARSFQESAKQKKGFANYKDILISKSLSRYAVALPNIVKKTYGVLTGSKLRKEYKNIKEMSDEEYLKQQRYKGKKIVNTTKGTVTAIGSRYSGVSGQKKLLEDVTLVTPSKTYFKSLQTKPGDTLATTTIFAAELLAPYIASKAVSGARDIYYKLGAKYIPQEQVFAKEVLSGKTKFPLAKSSKQTIARVKATRGKYKDFGNLQVVQTSTPSGTGIRQVKSPQELGKPLFEDPGVYVTSGGRGSPAFLRILDQADDISLSLVPSAPVKPTVYRIGVKGAKFQPDDVLEYVGKTREATFKATADFLKTAPKEYAYITKRGMIGKGELKGFPRRYGTIEEELIVAPKTRFAPIKKSLISNIKPGQKFYTTIKGRVVPLIDVIAKEPISKGFIDDAISSITKGTKSLKNIKSAESQLYSLASQGRQIPVSITSLFPTSNISSGISSNIKIKTPSIEVPVSTIKPIIKKLSSNLVSENKIKTIKDKSINYIKTQKSSFPKIKISSIKPMTYDFKSKIPKSQIISYPSKIKNDVSSTIPSIESTFKSSKPTIKSSTSYISNRNSSFDFKPSYNFDFSYNYKFGLDDSIQKIIRPKAKVTSKKAPAKSAVEAYGVEVRKGGVWSRVDMPGQRHNKNSAMHLGIKETSDSPARSFRLVKVGGKPTVYKNKPPKLLNRYYKKSGKGNRKLANAYIEKPKYAIQSKAERKAITQKGWATNRQLKKQRQAQTSFTNKIIKRGIF